MPLPVCLGPLETIGWQIFAVISTATIFICGAANLGNRYLPKKEEKEDDFRDPKYARNVRCIKDGQYLGYQRIKFDGDIVRLPALPDHNNCKLEGMLVRRDDEHGSTVELTKEKVGTQHVSIQFDRREDAIAWMESLKKSQQEHDPHFVPDDHHDHEHDEARILEIEHSIKKHEKMMKSLSGLRKDMEAKWKGMTRRVPRSSPRVSPKSSPTSALRPTSKDASTRSPLTRSRSGTPPKVMINGAMSDKSSIHSTLSGQFLGTNGTLLQGTWKAQVAASELVQPIEGRAKLGLTSMSNNNHTNSLSSLLSVGSDKGPPSSRRSLSPKPASESTDNDKSVIQNSPQMFSRGPQNSLQSFLTVPKPSERQSEGRSSSPSQKVLNKPMAVGVNDKLLNSPRNSPRTSSQLLTESPFQKLLKKPVGGGDDKAVSLSSPQSSSRVSKPSEVQPVRGGSDKAVPVSSPQSFTRVAAPTEGQLEGRSNSPFQKLTNKPVDGGSDKAVPLSSPRSFSRVSKPSDGQLDALTNSPFQKVLNRSLPPKPASAGAGNDKAVVLSSPPSSSRVASKADSGAGNDKAVVLASPPSSSRVASKADSTAGNDKAVVLASPPSSSRVVPKADSAAGNDKAVVLASPPSSSRLASKADSADKAVVLASPPSSSRVASKASEGQPGDFGVSPFQKVLNKRAATSEVSQRVNGYEKPSSASVTNNKPMTPSMPQAAGEVSDAKAGMTSPPLSLSMSLSMQGQVSRSSVGRRVNDIEKKTNRDDLAKKVDDLASEVEEKLKSMEKRVLTHQSKALPSVPPLPQQLGELAPEVNGKLTQQPALVANGKAVASALQGRVTGRSRSLVRSSDEKEETAEPQRAHSAGPEKQMSRLIKMTQTMITRLDTLDTFDKEATK